MTRIVRLTESDLTRLVKRVIKEEQTLSLNQNAKKSFDDMVKKVNSGFCVPTYIEGGRIRISCKKGYYEIQKYP
jgi:hypothetical protein